MTVCSAALKFAREMPECSSDVFRILSANAADSGN